MQPRLKSGFVVAAALRQADLAGCPGVIVRRGDDDAGGIVVILHGRTGGIVLSQSRDLAGDLVWMRVAGSESLPDHEVDLYVGRQVERDPDLWVIEFETPDLALPFDGRLADPAAG